MNAVLERLRAIAEASGGYLMTRQAEEAGISRGRLKQYVDSGELIQVCKGRYILPDTATDEYALIQSRSRRAIFSYGTALFFWGLSDRVPHIFDMTVPQGTNVTRIRRDHPDVRFHYVQAGLHLLGQTETQSPHGNIILLYDKERCICDMIRSRKQADMQLYTQAIKDYFSNHPNIRKLLKYCQRQSEIVRKRRRNFVVFRRGGNKNQVLPCSKRVLTMCCFCLINSLRSFRR